MLKNSPSDDVEGKNLLVSFRRHGGGVDLYRAYIESRESGSHVSQNKRDLILTKFNKGCRILEYCELVAELVRLEILGELDVVIGDILSFCENMPDGDNQLTALRDALKIGKFHAPIDTKLTHSKLACLSAWIMLYAKRQAMRLHMTQDHMATQIAHELSISKTTALNHWKGLINAEPWQAEWAKQICFYTKKKRNLSQKSASVMLKQHKINKPPSWRAVFTK